MLCLGQTVCMALLHTLDSFKKKKEQWVYHIFLLPFMYLLWLSVFQNQKEHEAIVKAYKEVQFSVHIDGLFGEFGPVKVSPHFIPLHVFICINIRNWQTMYHLLNLSTIYIYIECRCGRNGTNHRVRSISLLAHHPWHAGLQFNRHFRCPLNIWRSFFSKSCFNILIFILNLYNN